MLKAALIAPDAIQYTASGNIAMHSCDSKEHTAPPRVLPDEELCRLLRSSVYLQLVLTHFGENNSYAEFIPHDLFAREEYGVLCLSNLFRRVEVRSRKGLLYYYYVEQAYGHGLELLRGLVESGQADPMLCHFSYSKAQDLPPQSDRCFYELTSDRPAAAKEEMEAFRSRPFVDCCLSQWGAIRNSPGILLPGWELEEICADPDVRRLAGCVNNLYAYSYPLPGGSQGMQLRWNIRKLELSRCAPLDG